MQKVLNDVCQHVDIMYTIFQKILYPYAVSNENRDSMLNSLLKMKDVIKHAPNTYGGAMQSEKL